MGSQPIPTPTPTPTGPPSNTPSTPNPTPTPSPQANYPPIPSLPDLPSNTYQLLVNLSTAIDTACGSFSASGGQLSSIQTTTNTAVSGVVANSKGEATDGLNDLWTCTQKDFTYASNMLTTITAANALGGSPNQLQEVLNQYGPAIQNGVPAVEQLRNLVATNFSSQPSVNTVQYLVDMAQGLTNAMGNVNQALWMMISAINTLSGGIYYACQTGFSPTTPLPVFTQQVFSMESSGGSGGSGSNDATDQNTIEQWMASDPEGAELLIISAEAKGVSLDDIIALLQGGGPDAFEPEYESFNVDPEQIYEWIDNDNLSSDDIHNIVTLMNKGGAVSDQINNWIGDGINFGDAADLVNNGISVAQIDQWASSGQDLAQMNRGIQALMSRGITIDNIKQGLAQQVNKGWAGVSNPIRQNIAQTIKIWKNRSVGVNAKGSPNPNDGTHFENRENKLPGGPDNSQTGYVNPRDYTEYTVANPSGGNVMRIVVDKYGNMWYSSGHYNDSGWTPIPQSFIIQALGG